MRIRVLILLFFTTICNLISFTQPTIAWQRCYGGSKHDFFYDAIKTSDGGAISLLYTASDDGDLTGISSPFGWVIKFDSNLEIEWQNFYSDPTFNNALLNVIELGNTDFIFGGHGGEGCNNYHGAIDLFLMETNENGDTLWNKCYGSAGIENFTSFINTEDKGYLILGTSYSSGGDIPFHYGDGMSSDAVILKTDSMGFLEWIKNLGGTSIDAPLGDPIEVEKGIYSIHIYSASNDFDLEESDIDDITKRWVLLVDSIGNIIDQSFFSAEDDLYHSDGTIKIVENETMVIGSSNAASLIFPALEGHAGEEGALAFFDSNLNLVDLKSFGGSNDDRLYRFTKDIYNNFYFLGVSSSLDYDLPDNYNNGDNKDYWLLKTDSEFNMIWSKNFGGSDFSGDLGGGSFNGNLLIIDNILYAFLGSVTPSSFPDFDINCGYIEEDPELYDFMDAWIVAFDLSTEIQQPDTYKNHFELFPNPVNNILSIHSKTQFDEITIKILNINSQTIYTNSYNQPTDFNIQTNNFPNGIYLINFSTHSTTFYSSKFIVQH